MVNIRLTMGASYPKNYCSNIMARTIGKSWGSMGLPSLGLPSKVEDMVKIMSLKHRAQLKARLNVLSKIQW